MAGIDAACYHPAAPSGPPRRPFFLRFSRRSVLLIRKEGDRMTRLGPTRVRSAIAAILAGVALAGCELPNLQPYADATQDLRVAVASTGDQVAGALAENRTPDADVASFKAAYAAIDQSMEAFGNYSDSLAAIADAGEKGSENAGKVADSFNALIDGFGAVSPIGAVPANAIAVIKEAYGIVARVRAAQSMKAAVAAVNPSVQKFATLLEQDAVDMKTIVDRVAQNSTLRIQNCEAPYAPVDCMALKKLDAIAREYVKEAQKEQADLANLLAGGGKPNAAQLALANDKSALAADVSARLAQRKALLDDAAGRQRVRNELLDKIKDGVAAWAAIHARLAQDLADGTQPNVRNLAAAAKSISNLIEKVRAL